MVLNNRKIKTKEKKEEGRNVFFFGLRAELLPPRHFFIFFAFLSH
jgi:hypothetical protein